MTENVFCDVTFDQQLWHLKKLGMAFTRMRRHKITVTLTFDLLPPKSNQFIFESK